MLRLPLLALLTLSLAACDPVSGVDDPPPPPPPDEVSSRLASTLSEVWDTNTSTWLVSGSTDYAYDARGLLDQTTETGEGYVTDVTYTYDGFDRLTKSSFSTAAGNPTPSTSVIYFTYVGDSDRLAEQRRSPFRSGQPEDAERRDLYTYDSQNRLVLAASEDRPDGAAGTWTRCQETDYTYVSGEVIDQTIRRGSFFCDAPLTQLATRERYVYADTLVQSILTDQRFDDAWVQSTRTSFTYTAVGGVAVELVEQELGDGSGQPFFRTTYTYEDGPTAKQIAQPIIDELHGNTDRMDGLAQAET